MTEVLFIDVPAARRMPLAEWSLGYRYLVAALRKAGFRAEIVQPPFVTDGTARNRLLAEVVARSPRLIGLTTYDVMLPDLLGFVDALRGAGVRAHVTLGGLSASAAVDWVLQAGSGVDSVVRGEGEATIVALAQHVIRGVGRLPIAGASVRGEGGIVEGEPRPFTRDLDGLTAPAWDPSVAVGSGSPVRLRTSDTVPVTGSRGCYGRCTFCSVERFYRSSPRARPWRPFSARRIADDIDTATRATGARKVTFVDENFVGPGRAGRAHVLDVAEELRRRGRPVEFNLACRADDVDPATFADLRDAGLRGVTLGVEAMSQPTLDLFGKNTTPQTNDVAVEALAELGLDTEITYIFFHPLSTLREVRDSVAFVAKVAQLPAAHFNNGQPYVELVPLAGTALTAELQRRGHVRGVVGGYKVAYADPRVGLLARTTRSVPLDELALLGAALPSDGGGQVSQLRERLAAQHRWLAMHRLPELLCDACDAFGAERGQRVEPVLAAIRAEARRLRHLLDRSLSLLMVEEVGDGAAVPGHVGL